jgi:RecB family exonuclease
VNSPSPPADDASNQEPRPSNPERRTANSEPGTRNQEPGTGNLELQVSPRHSRLLRAPHLAAFRTCVADLACEGTPFDARDRLLVVPTRAAAALVVEAIGRRTAGTGAAVLPDFVTPREIVSAICRRLPAVVRVLTDAEREVLLGRASRTAREQGVEPPFHIRPALVAEMLRFYDALRRHQKDVAAFERLALERLESGAEIDRGAERLVRQTRFLVAAFRLFEAASREAGADEHDLRVYARTHAAARPLRHVVVTVSDRAFDRYGLHAADWDLLARLPGLERLDVVTTDAVLAGAPHERMHALLPGIEEVAAGSVAEVPRPTLLAPQGAPAMSARDREEEVASFVRTVKERMRTHRLAPERAALVVNAPLPYVYLSREIFRSAGVPAQMFDALPLAAEPYAAAFDLVCETVLTSGARTAALALLRSPHFDLVADVDGPPAGDQEGLADSRRTPCRLADVAALDRLLVEDGYLGGIEGLERLRERWQQTSGSLSRSAARRALDVLVDAMHELPVPGVLESPATHLDRLLAFLETHARPTAPDDPAFERTRRARRAVLGLARQLRDAYARFDPAPLEFEAVVAVMRRWIETHTFAPRAGAAGVHVVDAASARFGEFDLVQLAGLVDGEWPDRPRRGVFYGPDLLRDLGWPAASDRRDADRARFVDLHGLPREHLVVSLFALEGDAPVSPSVLLEDLEATFDATRRQVLEPSDARIFEYEALAFDPVVVDPLEPAASSWARLRQAHPLPGDRRVRGFTGPPPLAAWSLTALERYQDCPFRFFSSHVLRLEEEPEEASMLSARTRGRFVHDVLHRFIEAWDARGPGPVTVTRLDEARRLFVEVAEPLLARLPESDAALERARLYGSAASMGAMEVFLGVEASRPEPVEGRLLEHRFSGRYRLGATGGEPVALRGVADRVDLLRGRRLRVIDYKTGLAPDPKRALQAAAYALLAREELEQRDGVPWTIDEAAYVALGSARPTMPVVTHGDAGAEEALEAVRVRVHGVLRSIQAGAFPIRPHDTSLCRACAFPSVCRLDYERDG